MTASMNGQKLCALCGPENGPLPVSEFHPHGSTKDRLQSECKKCHNARRQEARRAKRGHYATERQRYHDSHLIASRKGYYQAKRAVFEHYGDKCVQCGFSDLRALSIDHMDGSGAEHRRQLKGINFYKWLVRQSFPPGFQVLCMNCQFIKRHEKNEHRPHILWPTQEELDGRPSSSLKG